MPQLPRLTDVHTIAFDFDGVFTNNKVWVNQDGIESVVCDRSDGLALDILRGLIRQGKLTCEMFILSTETNLVVKQRAAKLKIGCEQGVGNKFNVLCHNFNTRGIPVDTAFAGLIFFGNDLNDLQVIEQSSFSVVPRNAHLLVKRKASLVLDVDGGDGFVRTFVEFWLGANNIAIGDLNELISDR